MKNLEIIEMVNEQLIKLLENGVNPWIKPWKALYNGKPMPQYMAYNYVTKKAYRGINQLILPHGYYASFKQIKDLGGCVNKGCHSYVVVFFKWNKYEVENENESDTTEIGNDGREHFYKTIPLLRYDRVFNLEDTNLNIEYPTIDETKTLGGVEKIDEIENVISAYATKENLSINESFSDRACYSPSMHAVYLPLVSQFAEISEYYSTKFHELTHSTGRHFKREGIEHFDYFGSPTYSREELIAEMGACYCCGYFELSTEGTMRNSTEYLRGWAKALSNDKTISQRIISATTEATKAFEYIVGLNGKEND